MKKEILNKKIAIFLLLYFIVFTFYFSIITFSRYIGVIGNNKTTASIAKWDVSLDTSDNKSNTLELVNGNTSNSYILKLTSQSETIATYSIVLTNLPQNIRIGIDNETPIEPDENNSITFQDVGYINANAETKTVEHTLTFYSPIDSGITGLNEINIDVTFVQKEPEEYIEPCGLRGTTTQMISFARTPEAEACGVTGFVQDNTTDHNYRFIGANPNNYIKLNVDGNEELWRIIGIFDGKMKIIKSDLMGPKAYDDNNVNDFANSTMKSYLNNTYYNLIDDKNLIEQNSTWYLGSATVGLNLNYTRLTSYNAERDSASVHEGYAATTTAPIGLLYVSDYGYANEEHDSLDLDTTNLNNSSLANGYNWLYKKTKELTMNNIQNNARITIINTGSNLFIGNANADNTYYRPCLYLKSNVEIYKGSGSIDHPYLIRTAQ